MGSDMYLQAFIPDTDETYKKHKKVLIACNEADVDLPKETAEYFGYDYPEMCALEEKLRVELQKGVHYEEYRDDGVEGFDIELKKLPQGVTKIRVYNGY